MQLLALRLESQHRRAEVQRVSLPDNDVSALLQSEDLLDVGRNKPQRLVLAQARVLCCPRRLERKRLYPGVARRSLGEVVSGFSITKGRVGGNVPPSVSNAMP